MAGVAEHRRAGPQLTPSPTPLTSVVRPDSALVIPLPTLQPVLDRVADAHPLAVREHIPPHISVAYPFAPRADVTEQTVRALATIVAGHDGFTVRLGRPRSSPGILYSAPDPRSPVDRLVDDVESAWPWIAEQHAARAADLAPIGPHLTLALIGEQAHGDIATSVNDAFPCTVDVGELWLLIREPSGQWRAAEEFRLDEAPPGRSP